MQRLYPTSRAHGPPTAIYDELEFPPPPPDRPFVALNMVSTVDGKTTLDEGRRPGPIGSPVDRALMGRIRIPFDAVVRGAATVRRSPYYPGVPEELEHRRVARGLARQPLAVVVTASGDVPPDGPFFREGPRRPVVVAPAAVPARRLARLRDVADTLLVGEDRVDMGAAFRELGRRFGVRRLLAEGGPTLNYELLRDDLLDELFWTVAPKIGGFGADLTLVEGPAPLSPPPRLELLSAYAGDSELFLRYKTVRTPPPPASAGKAPAQESRPPRRSP